MNVLWVGSWNKSTKLKSLLAAQSTDFYATCLPLEQAYIVSLYNTATGCSCTVKLSQGKLKDVDLTRKESDASTDLPAVVLSPQHQSHNMSASTDKALETTQKKEAASGGACTTPSSGSSGTSLIKELETVAVQNAAKMKRRSSFLCAFPYCSCHCTVHR